jgi:archaeal cell division control protein 6
MSTVPSSSHDAELTQEKICAIRRKIERRNSVFSDKRFLDSLFLPSSVIGREKQTESILEFVMSVRDGLVVPFVSVYGRSGSGKSTVVKFVCQNLSDLAEHAFVNLRKSRTVFGCASLILSELGEETPHQGAGINRVIEEIKKKITTALEISKKNLFVLVLDEYDAIFSDSRGKPSDFVYKLLTLEEEMRERGLFLCVIGISNNALSQYELDDRVKSRMGSSEVFFEPYSRGDVLGIISDRAKKAFAIKIENKVLEYCATLSSDDHGDARRALDLLRVAGEICDGKKITQQNIDSAQQKITKDRISVIVSSSSYHSRVLIAAICSNALFSGHPWTSTSEIHKKYLKTISSDKKPLSYRRIVDLLVEIENSGLVESRTISRGRYGYGNEYKLRTSPDLIGPIVSEEWWNGQVDLKVRRDAVEDLKKQIETRSKNNPFRNVYKNMMKADALMKKYGK